MRNCLWSCVDEKRREIQFSKMEVQSSPTKSGFWSRELGVYKILLPLENAMALHPIDFSA